MPTDKHGREIAVGDWVRVENIVERLDVDAGGVVWIGEFGCPRWKLPSQVEVIAPGDAEPITAERLRADGWSEGENGWMAASSRDGIRVGWDTNEGVTLDVIGEDDELVTWRQLPQIKNMGQLRRLVAALKGE